MKNEKIVWILLVYCFIRPSQISANNIRFIQSEGFSNTAIMSLLAIDKGTLELNVKDCPELKSDKTKDLKRKWFEIILICNALRYYSFASKIQFVIAGNNLRQVVELAKNRGDIIGHTFFANSININPYKDVIHVLKSAPLLLANQSPLGFFTNQSQYQAVAEQLRQGSFESLIGITHTAFSINADVMEQLGVGEIRQMPRYLMIARNIYQKRANFTLASLNQKQLGKNLPLFRIEGFKTQSNERRVFFINRKRDDLRQLINRYLRELRSSDDRLSKLFLHTGFITTELLDFKEL